MAGQRALAGDELELLLVDGLGLRSALLGLPAAWGAEAAALPREGWW